MLWPLGNGINTSTLLEEGRKFIRNSNFKQYMIQIIVYLIDVYVKKYPSPFCEYPTIIFAKTFDYSFWFNFPAITDKNASSAECRSISAVVVKRVCFLTQEWLFSVSNS